MMHVVGEGGHGGGWLVLMTAFLCPLRTIQHREARRCGARIVMRTTT